ncbi:hypothetical protein THYS13_07640 [Thermoanaerobacter sp. YS13]|uniref:hypothetical protein n=1 Tax=Thermoanaerobacter sp. YS13 TaxID=1511746 RepID=UPI0005732F71|nr:hypothetical protein [Thermoanaerobacter sp. YS13]KHO62701.1 hypothetical protein THYS13_07640 [Thermoanaerobacter sp. YS13]
MQKALVEVPLEVPLTTYPAKVWMEEKAPEPKTEREKAILNRLKVLSGGDYKEAFLCWEKEKGAKAKRLTEEDMLALLNLLERCFTRPVEGSKALVSRFWEFL